MILVLGKLVSELESGESGGTCGIGWEEKREEANRGIFEMYHLLGAFFHQQVYNGVHEEAKPVSLAIGFFRWWCYSKKGRREVWNVNGRT
jgi:hypothetical protein